jgi:hypothetical protein
MAALLCVTSVGQPDNKFCAFALAALIFNGAAVRFDRAFDNCQSETCSGDCAHVATAIKHFKEMKLIRFGNADTAVAYLDLRVIFTK